MAIISFSKDTVVDYMPEYGGNRKSDNPCVVGIRFIPFGETIEIEKVRSARMRGVEPEKVLEINQTLQKERFIKHIAYVKGFFVGETEVTDAGEFYDTTPDDLMGEVLVAMRDSAFLSKGQVANFKQASV